MPGAAVRVDQAIRRSHLLMGRRARAAHLEIQPLGAATGFHVPDRVVTNDELSRMMDTSDEWIRQRSGIRTRHWVSDGETGASLARAATLKALARASLQPSDLDCIVYCTCTPRPLRARQRRVPGLAHDPYISEELIREGRHRAVMDGRDVFKFASILMPQSVVAALQANCLTPADVTLLVPHQANQRIMEMVQKAIGLRDDQVYVNIEKYGNTTAASIPIALDEALCAGRLERGDVLVLTAFGSGFTWASAAVRW